MLSSFESTLRSLRCLQWLAVYAFAMQGPNPFERVKKPLIVVCVGYGLLMFALFISMVAGNPSVETKQQIALAGIYSLL